MHAGEPGAGEVGVGLERLIVVSVPRESVKFEDEEDMTGRHNSFHGVVGYEFFVMEN